MGRLILVSPDGTRLAVERQGNGTPLVLVHGSATAARQWDGFRAALPPDYECWVMDRRHRGRSREATDTAGIGPEGADIKAVLDAAGPDAVLLAHSYGARCAIEALLQGARAARAVLYEPMLRPTMFDVAALEHLETLSGEPALRHFLVAITRTPPAIVDAMTGTPAWERALATADTLARETRNAVEDTLDLADLRRIDIPVRLLLGERSPQHFRADVERYAAALPDAEIRVLPGQGHLALDLAPEAVVAAL